jgi:beta-lactamase regulating signal transducer with metallopeptidase domain
VTAETLLLALIRINLVGSAAILLVLMLRPLVLRCFGAAVGYWLWLAVPIALAASVLPAHERLLVVPPPQVVVAMPEEGSAVAAAPVAPERTFARVAAPGLSIATLEYMLIAIWLLGAGTLFVRSIVSTRRLAADPSVGPALIGVFRPKLVLPADFETRFGAEERALILAHERVHRISGHTIVNALVEFARCASWFNPLVHLAATSVRTDQELARDAAVIAAHPAERRVYAEALL